MSKQQTFLEAFQAADARAEAEHRKQEFRRGIILSLGVHESMERLLLALDAIAQRDGIADADGNISIDPTKEEIADEMDCSVDTARRWWRAAQKEGFLLVEESPGRSNIFTLLWPAMFNAATPSNSPGGGGSRGSRRGGSRGSKRGLATPKNQAQGGSSNAPHSWNESMNMNLHESMNGDLEISRRKKFSLQPGLEIADFRDPDHVADLWELCLCHPSTQHMYRRDEAADRLNFFAWCHCVHRKREKLAKPVGFFHAILGQGPRALARQVDDAHDLAWARAVIAKQECDFEQPAPVSDYEFQLQQDNEFHRHKAEQMQRLREEAAKHGEFIP